MGKLKYILFTIAAALMAMAESIRASAENVPAVLDADADGVFEPGEATNDSAPSVDSTGLPWDERIHSGGKSIKADGTWTKKKGATPPVVAAVEAELRAKQAAGGTPTIPTSGVPLPQLGGLPQLGATPYQKLIGYLALKTGPGKVADDAWVKAAFDSFGITLASLATDGPKAELVLAEFKKVLGE